MILYYAPGACSLACHIALIESGLLYELIAVGRDKQTSDGRDFHTINEKGYTPALELDDGSILTENAVILAYIADRSGKLLASDGMERWRALEATVFMNTEIHRHFIPFFRPDSTQEDKDKARKSLDLRFPIVDKQLGDKPFLVGEQMTIADAYLFVMLAWAAMMGIPVPERLERHFGQLRARPAVAKALADEGL